MFPLNNIARKVLRLAAEQATSHYDLYYWRKYESPDLNGLINQHFHLHIVIVAIINPKILIFQLQRWQSQGKLIIFFLEFKMVPADHHIFFFHYFQPQIWHETFRENRCHYITNCSAQSETWFHDKNATKWYLSSRCHPNSLACTLIWGNVNSFEIHLKPKYHLISITLASILLTNPSEFQGIRRLNCCRYQGEIWERSVNYKNKQS